MATIARVALVLSLVVLAGCNFGQGPRQTHTSTPAPVPSETAASIPPTTAPPAGVQNPFERARIHTSSLQQTAYTVNETYVIRYRNGTVYHRRVATTRVGANRSTYNFTSRARTEAPNHPGNHTTYAYSNGSVAALRVSTADGMTDQVFRPREGEPFSSEYVTTRATNEERLAFLYSIARNVSIAEEGEAGYVLRATTIAEDTLEVDGIEIQNTSVDVFSARFVDGLVREYLLRLQGTVGGRSVTVTEQVRYSMVGNTSIAPPERYLEQTTPTLNPTE